jgi:vancomycin permeability regulator SanA
MDKDKTNIVLGKNIMIMMIIIFNLLFSFYLKYSSNSVSLSAFKLDYLGNLLNIVNTGLLFFVFILFLTVKKNQYHIRNIRFILFLSLLYLIPLLVLMYIYQTGFDFPDNYIFDYPLEKVAVAGLYLSNTLLQILLSFIIIGMIFSSGKILLIKPVILLLIGSIVLASAAYLYSLKKQNKYEELDRNDKYDVAVVLGAAVWQKNEPSTLFRGRIDKALELYKNGKVSKIQLTGGNAPGELSEARTAQNYLAQFEIPESDIQIEEITGTTSEQIKYIKRELSERSKLNKIIIISDEFHLARVNEMCSFFRVKALTIASDYSLNSQKLVYYRIRDSIGLLFFWLYAI